MVLLENLVLLIGGLVLGTIAALVAAERNGELAAWWRDRELPSWDDNASAPSHDHSCLHIAGA